MVRTIPILVLVAQLLRPGVGAGQPRGTPNDDVLRDRHAAGTRLAETGQVEEAIRIWEALILEASGKLLRDLHFDLAVGYERQDRLPEAWHHLVAYLPLLQQPHHQAEELLETVEAGLRKTLVRVEIACDIAEASVFLDREGFHVPQACPLTWWLRPGTHQVRIEAAGREPRVRELNVVGQSGISSFTLAAGPELDAADTILTALNGSVEIVEPPPTFRTGQVWGWSLAGAGAASLVTAAILHGAASAREGTLRDRYPADPTLPATEYYENEDAYDRAWGRYVRPRLIGAYTLYAVSAAAAATGTTLLLRDRFRSRGDAVYVAPLPAGGGLLLGIAF